MQAIRTPCCVFRVSDEDNIRFTFFHRTHLLSGLRALFVPSGRKPALSPRIFVVKAKLRRVCLFRSLPSEKVALTAKILDDHTMRKPEGTPQGFRRSTIADYFSALAYR